MLEATIIGNLGQDAEVKDINGKQYIVFSVAHTDRYTDQTGQKIERTTWANVTKPRGESDRLLPWLKKGTEVYVRGSLTVRMYQSKSGEMRTSVDIRCLHLELLGGRRDGQQQAIGTTDELPY